MTRRDEPPVNDLAAALEWIRQANVHLAGLEAECDKFKELIPSHSAVLEWIRGAETHLAALQAGYDRMHALLQRHDEQLPRLIARMALLDSRLSDLERATNTLGDPPG